MAKRGFKRKGEPRLRYGTAIVKVRWPYLAMENLEVTAEYSGCKMLLQIESIQFVDPPETVKGSGSVQ